MLYQSRNSGFHCNLRRFCARDNCEGPALVLGGDCADGVVLEFGQRLLADD
jgi:hypothetical protein